MAKMLYFAFSLLGGWIGWALGERFGVMTAFFVSLIGTALGVYFAHRINRAFQ